MVYEYSELFKGPLYKQKEEMQVTIKNVDVQWNGEGRKKWGKAAVEYTYNGEARRQNVMSFTNPDVFKKVQELEGQTVEVELTKNDKGYSEWKSLVVSGASTVSGATTTSTGATTRVTGSNYETPAERAARQVLIVRQSSVSNAVAVLSVGAKAPPEREKVTDLAQFFVDFVFQTEENKTGFDDMGNDIPF